MLVLIVINGFDRLPLWLNSWHVASCMGSPEF